MRNIILLLFSFSFFLSVSQTNSDLLNLSFENKTTEEVIIQIESETNYRFYFLKEWLSQEPISGNYTNQSVEDILTDIFKNTNLNFYITNDNRIILTENNAIHDTLPDTNSTISPAAIAKPIFDEELKDETIVTQEEPIKIGKEDLETKQTTFIIKGYVRDSETGQPLSNVAITVNGTGIGTSTNADGYYELELSPGTYTLRTNSLNAKDVSRTIEVFNNGEINFSLEENVETLQEVVVDAEAEKNVKEVVAGVTKIEVENIKNIPLVLGEQDIMKVATTLPGISNTGEGSSGYNVRGGRTDQNLILLDNGSIYNPTHFFGIFSAINPFTTGDVEIYKGNIPAEFGGRLSSVFDISTKDANVEEFSGQASIGPVTSSLSLEIPIVQEKAGLMVGGRSTYSNWILRAIDDESIQNSEASFYDVIVKYNHKISDNDELRATGYYSNDKFSITSDSLFGYSNQLFSLEWKHRYNDKIRSDVTVTNSKYQFDIEYDGDFSNDFDLDYSNSETEFKIKLDHLVADDKSLNYGIASKLYTIRPGSYQPLNSESNIEPLTLQKEKGLESAVFLSFNYDITEKLAIDAGVRYSFYAYLGEATQRIYEEGQPRNDGTLVEVQEFDNNEIVETYDGFEGRFSARYFLQDDFSVKASYNNTYQYIHTLSTNTTVSPTDTWKLSDINIKPQRAQQVSLGFYKNFADNTYETSIEGYYKTYDNILDYKVGAQLLLNESLETEVIQGEGKSYGIEFLVKKNGGRWNGWIGYTYSRTLIKLDSEFAEERVNNGEYFPANYDKPHDFSAVLNYKMTQRFSFSANLVYQTGRPVTYPVGTYEFGGAEYTLYSDRNQFRIPDYYRLDIGFNYEGNHKRNKLAHSFWNLSIYNVLGRNNPYSVFFVTEEGEIKAYQSSIFTIPIPTISFNFQF